MTFRNYAEAKAYTNFDNEQTYFIAGHSDSDDGGGGRFVFLDDNSLVPDDGCILEIASGGRLVRQYSNLPDPRWWGGKHLTESTAAVQAAIRKGGVYLATGVTYLIQDRLILEDGTTIVGEGYDSVLQSTNDQVCLLWASSKTGVSITSARFIGTGNLTSGNGASQFAGTGFGAIRCKRTKVTNCHFEKFSSNQIHFEDSDNSTVSNNHCYDGVNNTRSDINFYAGCSNFTVTNNICTSNRKQNISVSGLNNAPCVRFSISNNVCAKLDSNFMPVPNAEAGAHNILANYAGDECHASITGNVCYWSGFAGIYVAAGGSNLVISGNQCSYNGLNTGTNLAGGISIGGKHDGLVVDGNLVYNHGYLNPKNRAGAIQYNPLMHEVDGELETTRVTITNNVVDTASKYGILLSHFVDHVNVQGNTIRKTQSHGIAFIPSAGGADGVFGGIISNNLIEMGGEACGICLLTYTETAKRVKVENNFITNTTKTNTPGFANARGAASNSGIFLGRSPHYTSPYNLPCTVAHNTIRGFHTGISFVGALESVDATTDERDLFRIIVSDNDLEDLTDGYYVYGKGSKGLLPIQRSYEKDVVNRAAVLTPAGHVNVALMDCEVVGEQIILHGIYPNTGSVPSNRPFQMGDKVFNTAVGSGVPVGFGHDGTTWISMGQYQ